MLEIIKHAFGFCGEPHITVWHIFFTPAGWYLFYKFKRKKK
tara:strand:+ start:20836 stop:20958 length:123 start_codon:yes stop_codon:yes gene_type:complete